MDKNLKKLRQRYIAWGCCAALVLLLAILPMAAAGKTGADAPQASILSAQVERQEEGEEVRLTIVIPRGKTQVG